MQSGSEWFVCEAMKNESFMSYYFFLNLMFPNNGSVHHTFHKYELGNFSYFQMYAPTESNTVQKKSLTMHLMICLKVNVFCMSSHSLRIPPPPPPSFLSKKLLLAPPPAQRVKDLGSAAP